MPNPILIAKGDRDNYLLPQMANRHGLISGATGTGKTISMKVLAEGFSAMGVPCFMGDVKGDFTGVAKPGGGHPKVDEKIKTLRLADFEFKGFSVEFWDLYGKKGHPVRTTVSDMGPLLMGRLLNLNDTQSGVLSLIFKVADDNGLLLLDLKDLRSMVQHVGERASEFRNEYGNVSPASIGAIQRNLLTLQEQGGGLFFGEPALNLADFMQTDSAGRGIINILAADQLVNAPKLYATFLLWLLAELFEQLPEAGDLDKPKLVFFFDEAHLLFTEAPPVLMQKIEQVVRLVRSKGVGIYFITQNPIDVPDIVLGQLGNRIQHALRAFTPRDQKAVRAAAETFRPNPKLDVEQTITELGVGEALISLLDAQGRPEMVDRAYVLPPRSQVPPITDEERAQLVRASLVGDYYQKTLDRESAYEVLQGRAREAAATIAATPPQLPAGRVAKPKPSVAGGLAEAFAKSAARAVGNQLGRSILRGIMGSIMGGGRSRR